MDEEQRLEIFKNKINLIITSLIDFKGDYLKEIDEEEKRDINFLSYKITELLLKKTFSLQVVETVLINTLGPFLILHLNNELGWNISELFDIEEV